MSRTASMTARAKGARALLAACLVCASAQAKIIALEIEIPIDKLGPQEQKMGMKPGDVHRACVYYDDAKVDPQTKRVAAIHQTHASGVPKHLNPRQMPMTNAWLDLSSNPIRYHFAAAPTTAFPQPYFILFDEKTLRMSIYSQADGSLLMGGNYKVKPEPFTGPHIDAVVAASDPELPPWQTAPQGWDPAARGRQPPGPDAGKPHNGADHGTPAGGARQNGEQPPGGCPKPPRAAAAK